MSDSNLQDQIEAARGYESLLVPALFGEWAVKVADAANIKQGQRVLDVACGTGVLSRELATRTTSSGGVTGLDPNCGMLALAKERSPAIDWQEGVAESLPFTDESFDAVVSQFGLMFFVDREKAIREMLRVLSPGGRMVVAVWDSLSNIPAYATTVALLEELAGKEAANALRAPYALGDSRELSALFAAAGATSVSIATHSGKARFPSIAVMVEADLRGWLPVMGIELSEQKIAQILDRAEEALDSYTTRDGSVVFESPAHIIEVIKE
ncbi:MAG: methyltransferase domain-containing protein [Halioglobus sp.]